MKTNTKPKAKRIKKVFSSASEVLHRWANQTQPDARQAGRSRCYFEGTRCYSYGPHYLLGELLQYRGQTVAVINGTGYSHTTSRHIQYVKSAVSHLPNLTTKSVWDVKQGLVARQGELIDCLMAVFIRRSFYKGCLPLGRDAGLTRGISEFNKLCDTLRHPELRIDVTAGFRELVHDHFKKCLRRQSELDVNKVAQQAIRDAQNLRKAEEEIQSWRQGGILTKAVRALRPMLLRVKADTVETSNGAAVPLIDAQEMLWLIRVKRFKVGDPIGSYNLNSVKDGMVKIGCHTITLAEAEAVLRDVK